MTIHRGSAIVTLRRCCNCRRPFISAEAGLLVEENVEACCSECYWSACMDPTGVRRRTQARKGKREGGAAAAARARRRRSIAAAAVCTPAASPASTRRGRVSTYAAENSWDVDAVPPLEGTKWFGGCDVGDGQESEPGSAHAMFEFHMHSLGGDEGSAMTAG